MYIYIHDMYVSDLVFIPLTLKFLRSVFLLAPQ